MPYMNGTWIEYHNPDDKPHLIPIGDAITHTATQDCICGPTDDGREWVHHQLSRP